MKNEFSVSVAIATFNSENTLEKCIESIRLQNYPQKKIEIILADGGSKDKTLAIAKKYRAKVIRVPFKKQNAEYNKGIAIRHAKGDVLLLIDHDNVLPHRGWLKKMLLPLLDDKSIVGVETLRYHYDPKASLLDRYFALFGAGDPLAFYLGKADRLSYLSHSYNLLGRSVDKGAYVKVKFSIDRIPTLGANGFVVRRKILISHAKSDPEHFFHIDVNVDLIRNGFNTFAFIKDDIIHLTGYKKISNFLKRRKLFMEQYYIHNKSLRRYSVYTRDDNLRLVVFIVYAITFIKPLYDSVRGYLKIQDWAWFLHPLLCFCLFIIYSSVAVKAIIKRYV